MNDAEKTAALRRAREFRKGYNLVGATISDPLSDVYSTKDVAVPRIVEAEERLPIVYHLDSRGKLIAFEQPFNGLFVTEQRLRNSRYQPTLAQQRMAVVLCREIEARMQASEIPVISGIRDLPLDTRVEMGD